MIKRNNVEDFPILPVITHYEYSLFPLHVFHIVICVSVRGVSIAVNEIIGHMDADPSRWMCSSAMARISHLFIGCVPAKTQV